MKELKDISVVYFIGIGGIGMSALARFFHQRGIKVSGYDKTMTPLTSELVAEGIPVHYDDDMNLISKDADLVVYTPAIPDTHTELSFYRANQYTIMKRSEVLGMLTRSLRNICVAGTHGKTTISTMAAHLLRASGLGCNAFLGGISVNYNTNFWSHSNDVCVLEADEFDRSFHRLDPEVAIISSMDADHLDIYGTEEEMQQAFVTFTKKIKSGGWLIKKTGLPKDQELSASHTITYHLSDSSADVHTTNLRVEEGGYSFDIVLNRLTDQPIILREVRLNAGGYHNVENALAAVAAAMIMGADKDKIIQALGEYKGVRRRFEYVISPGNGKITLIDDYAHHPAELKALIEGVRSLFPEHYLLLVFQPHLFTRTRDLADGFAESLDLADQVLLLPIYPARELPIQGVTSLMIVDKMKLQEKELISKELLGETIEQALREVNDKNKPVVVVTAGAGDIDTLLKGLKAQFIHE
jgi:UDP-N-acetylmuramate--alanine ligase